MALRGPTGTRHLGRGHLQGVYPNTFCSPVGISYSSILIVFFFLSSSRFSRGQGPDSRAQGGPRDSGEVVKRPSILKQDDLKELDELDHDGDDGWAGTEKEVLSQLLNKSDKCCRDKMVPRFSYFL